MLITQRVENYFSPIHRKLIFKNHLILMFMYVFLTI